MVPHYPPFLGLFQKCQQSPDVLTFDAFASSWKLLDAHQRPTFVSVLLEPFKGVFGQ